MHRCPGDVIGRKLPSYLYRMPRRSRPCLRQRASKNAGAGRAPYLIRIEAGCSCCLRYCLDCLRHIRPERKQLRAVR